MPNLPQSGALFIESVEMQEWPVPGPGVSASLDDRVTVLVGRNAAGKSLFLEGLYWGIRTALVGQAPPPGRPRAPNHFAITVKFAPSGARLRYSYSRTSEESELEENPPKRTHSEKCEWLGDPPEIVWELNNGEGSVHGNTKIVVTDSVVTALSNLKEPVHEATVLSEFFRLTQLVSAGVPRDRSYRHEYIARKGRFAAAFDRRIGRLATLISRWQRDNPPRFQELVELGRRLQVFREIEMKTLASEDSTAQDELLDVRFDGANIGVLSDGTLRVTEILVALLSSSLLLIEEPETGIHPALLERLLPVFESYAADRQIVISTHSPLVVNWAQPQQIRIVEHTDAGTSIRSLSHDQIAIACKHLEEAPLGEFVYGGGADTP